jgi:hypothetical protein
MWPLFTLTWLLAKYTPEAISALSTGPLLCAIPRLLVIVLLIQSYHRGLAYLLLLPDVLRFPAPVRILIRFVLQTMSARKSGIISCSKFRPTLGSKNHVPGSHLLLDPLAGLLAGNEREYLSLRPISESVCFHGSQWWILLCCLRIPCPLAQTQLSPTIYSS